MRLILPKIVSDAATLVIEYANLHDAYLLESQRLREKYTSQIRILIGFEGEWITPSYGAYIRSLASHPAVDYFIGSIHHVDSIPIDYNKELYIKAKQSTGGTEESLWERYYDQQYEMLETLRPKIVGHFDLIRLLSDDPERDVTKWDGVWSRIIRNLELVYGFGGILECNSAALRKGLAQPYPCDAIAQKWLEIGGRFTISDDSHGIAQIATNYGDTVAYLRELGVEKVYCLERLTGVEGCKTPQTSVKEIEVPLHAFEGLFR